VSTTPSGNTSCFNLGTFVRLMVMIMMMMMMMTTMLPQELIPRSETVVLQTLM